MKYNMKGGRIALPIEYFSEQQSGNYSVENGNNFNSRAQIDCTNTIGPDLHVQNGGVRHKGSKKKSMKAKKAKAKPNNNANNNNMANNNMVKKNKAKKSRSRKLSMKRKGPGCGCAAKLRKQSRRQQQQRQSRRRQQQRKSRRQQQQKRK